jgi:hypothetical protein
MLLLQFLAMLSAALLLLVVMTEVMQAAQLTFVSSTTAAAAVPYDATVVAVTAIVLRIVVHAERVSVLLLVLFPLHLCRSAQNAFTACCYSASPTLCRADELQ